jgi:hypothetical protein
MIQKDALIEAAHSPLRQGRLFIVALLLGLAAALIPALCFSGPPATRATGSAFDPSTSIVALHGRDQALSLPDTVRDKTPGKALPAWIEAAPLSLPLPVLLRTAAASQFPAPNPARDSLRRMTAAQPRAPPVGAA